MIPQTIYDYKLYDFCNCTFILNLGWFEIDDTLNDQNSPEEDDLGKQYFIDQFFKQKIS